MGLLLQAHTLAGEGARWQLGGGGKLLRTSQLRKPLLAEKPVVPQQSNLRVNTGFAFEVLQAWKRRFSISCLRESLCAVCDFSYPERKVGDTEINNFVVQIVAGLKVHFLYCCSYGEEGKVFKEVLKGRKSFRFKKEKAVSPNMEETITSLK